jgi:hypothetical protein
MSALGLWNQEKFMPDIIDLMERIGRDSALRYASWSQLDKVLCEWQVSPELRAALATAHRGSANTNVCCMINAPIEDWDEEKKPQKAQLPLSRVA